MKLMALRSFVTFVLTLGHAIKQLFPEAKMAIGPAPSITVSTTISTWSTLTQEDSEKIEKRERVNKDQVSG